MTHTEQLAGLRKELFTTLYRWQEAYNITDEDLHKVIDEVRQYV